MNRKFLIIILLTIFVIGGLYTFTMDKDVQENVENNNIQTEKTEEKQDFFAIEIGNEAPDFTLENLDGEKVSLSDLRGKNVLINFWATWCPYCVKEMPDLNKLYVENKDNDFVVLAVDVAEPKSDVQKYLADKDYEFPVLLDKDGKVSAEYMVRGIPTSIMVDKEGKIRNIKMQMLTYPEMREMLASIEGK